MKRITLLIAFLTITITCFGQKIEINGFGTTSLSHKAVEMSSAQIADFGRTKLHNNIPNPGFFSRNATVYKVDNVLVSVRYKSLKRNVDPDAYVSTTKRVFDALMSSQDPSYISKIEIVNGKKFLITSQKMRGNIIIAFYGVNSSTLTSLQGSVQCTPEDEAEANATLRELLTNLKYKVQ